MAASATHSSRIGTASRRMVCGTEGRRRGGCSSGLVQAEGVGVHCVDGPFVFDDAVDGDAAADGVAIALRHNVADDRGSVVVIVNDHGRGAFSDLPRLSIDVQVVDGRHRSGGAEDLEDRRAWG